MAVQIGQSLFSKATANGHDPAPSSAAARTLGVLRDLAKSGNLPGPAKLAGAVSSKVVQNFYPPVSMGNGSVNSAIKQRAVSVVERKVGPIDRLMGLRYLGGLSEGAVPGFCGNAYDPTMAAPMKNAASFSSFIAGAGSMQAYFNVDWGYDSAASVPGLSSSSHLYKLGSGVTSGNLDGIRYFGLYPVGAPGAQVLRWGFSSTPADQTTSVGALSAYLEAVPAQTTLPVLAGDLVQTTASSMSVQVSTDMNAQVKVNLFSPDCYPRLMSRRQMVKLDSTLAPPLNAGIPGLVYNPWVDSACAMRTSLSRSYWTGTPVAGDNLLNQMQTAQPPELVGSAEEKHFFGLGPPLDSAWRETEVDGRMPCLRDGWGATGWVQGQPGYDFTDGFFGSCRNIAVIQALGTGTTNYTVTSAIDYAVSVGPRSSVNALQCLTAPTMFSSVRRCSAGCSGIGDSLESAYRNAVADSVQHCVMSAGFGREIVPTIKYSGTLPAVGVAKCVSGDLTKNIRS